MMIFTLRTLLVLAFLAVVIFFQIVLSRTNAAWPGLILPGISFLLSLTVLLNLAAPISPLELFLTLLLSNIPTLILLAIYGFCRDSRKKKKQAELDKMNIQDLN